MTGGESGSHGGRQPGGRCGEGRDAGSGMHTSGPCEPQPTDDVTVVAIPQLSLILYSSNHL
jgi:hypothetical protein